MRHFILPLFCLALLTGCSVDRYTLQGRVVSDAAAGAESMGAKEAGRLPSRPLPRTVVSLIVDAEDPLHRKELGSFECDANGNFEVRDINAPGVELISYPLRIDAYAQDCAPLHCTAELPGPGHVLVLRMVPDPGAAGTAPPRPGHAAPKNDDYLQNTLRESEPYLNGGK